MSVADSWNNTTPAAFGSDSRLHGVMSNPNNPFRHLFRGDQDPDNEEAEAMRREQMSRALQQQYLGSSSSGLQGDPAMTNDLLLLSSLRRAQGMDSLSSLQAAQLQQQNNMMSAPGLLSSSSINMHNSFAPHPLLRRPQHSNPDPRLLQNPYSGFAGGNPARPPLLSPNTQNLLAYMNAREETRTLQQNVAQAQAQAQAQAASFSDNMMQFGSPSSAREARGHQMGARDVDDRTSNVSQRRKSFPERLMDLLGMPEVQHIICWLPAGHAFIIVRPKVFASEILPRYFRQAKYASFTRKLNRWGFRQITKGAEHGAFQHKLFQRDKPLLCLKMFCGGTAYPKSARRRASDIRKAHEGEEEEEGPTSPRDEDSSNDGDDAANADAGAKGSDTKPSPVRDDRKEAPLAAFPHQRFQDLKAWQQSTSTSESPPEAKGQPHHHRAKQG